MILVVGGAGYIGSHMVKALLEAGREVLILDNLSTGNRDLVPGGTFIEGDLGDAALLLRLLSEYPVDAVMHFAACSLVGESVEKPLKYYDNNVSRTATLLRAMRDTDVRRFIFSSSAAVYGEPESVPIPEDAPLRPTNPYGVTKMVVERMLADCDQAHGLRYMSLRYFNAAGADPSGTLGERHDPETHLIPLVLKTLTGERDSITIFGNDYPTPDGTCIRDYIHVNDLAQAHLLALEALENDLPSAVYNLGTNRGFSVLEVIRAVENVTQQSVPSEMGSRRAGDPARLVADSALIQSELGWKPRWTEPRAIISTAWNFVKKQLSG